MARRIGPRTIPTAPKAIIPPSMDRKTKKIGRRACVPMMAGLMSDVDTTLIVDRHGII